MQKNSLVEGVIYRLIRRHIAGPTMASALKKAKELNIKSFPVSITFLIDPPNDRLKANYITTTYMQLIRQISRLGLRASVEISAEQLGSNISKTIASENLNKILEVANNSGIFVWTEIRDAENEHQILSEFTDAKRFGIVFPSIQENMKYIEKDPKLQFFKVLCKEYKEPAKGDKKDNGEKKAIKDLEYIIKKSKNLTVVQPNKKIMNHLIKNKIKGKTIFFEFQLGYGEGKLNSLTKKGINVSISMPFGRDWIPYAMNNVPEKYMRVIANSLLKDKK